MVDFSKVSFLGCGNMGGAVLQGMLRSGQWNSKDITVFDTNASLLEKRVMEWGVGSAGSLQELLGAGSVLVSAVKPQVFPEVMASVKPLHGPEILISVMAGLSVQKIQSLVESSLPVVRTMPNLPLSVGQGATAIVADGHPDELLGEVEKMFRPSGLTVRVNENQIDAVTAVSGSGPMYVFEFVESLVKGGVSAGLDRETALALALQTLEGAAALLKSGGESPEEWTRKVCSPGGTTLAALEVLKQNGFHQTVRSAVEAAARRSRELGG